MERTQLLIVLCLCVSLAGCVVDDDSPQACRYSVNSALSQAQWEHALELLDSRACEAAFSPEERDLNYAAAHTGLAGFDLPDLIQRGIRHASIDTREPDPDRLLALLADFRPAWNTLTHLLWAQQHQTNLMRAYEGLARGACRRSNFGNLSRLQRDACFHYGMLALIQVLAGFSLLVPGEIDDWLGSGDQPPPRDHNRSGLPDQAETSACALQAIVDGDLRQGGSCPTPPGAGAVSWHRLGAQPVVYFHDNGREVARAVPLRIEIADAEQPLDTRSYYRLARTHGEHSLVLTAGFCRSVDIRQACSAADPAADCWPCPVLLPNSGALSVYEGFKEALNVDVEALFAMLPENEVARARAEVDELRRRICASAEGVGEPCAVDERGRPLVDQTALVEYLRQRIR